MVDPTDRKSIRRAEAAARRQGQTDREVIVALMDHVNGRDYVWRKLEAAHIFHTSFTDNPYLSAFREGERCQGLQLLADVVNHCPNQFILMMREANARSAATEYRGSQNGDGRAEGSADAPSDDDLYAEYDRSQAAGSENRGDDRGEV